MRVKRHRARGEIKHEIDPSSSETTAREEKDKKKREKRDEGADMDRDERLAVQGGEKGHMCNRDCTSAYGRLSNMVTVD